MLWPPLGVIGLFVAVALLDALTLLPGWLHLAVVVAFVIALAVASRKLLHGLVPPAGKRRATVSNGTAG